MSFFEQIENKRLALGITKAKFIEDINVSPRTYFYWAEGREPRQTTQKRILDKIKLIEFNMHKTSTGFVMLDCYIDSFPKNKLFKAAEFCILAKAVLVAQKAIAPNKIKSLNKAIALVLPKNIISNKFYDTSEFIAKDVAFLDIDDLKSFIFKIIKQVDDNEASNTAL